MSKYEVKMTRQQMQDASLIIENLLNAAMSMQSEPNQEDAFTLIDQAHDRIHRLNLALDAVNAPEEMA